ncbi:twin-arginine translocation protein, TatA/E family subunit [Richelia sinica FACHB-800]|uniref:Sec-independent protein translocase protein TatA n=1 Tax=Richelia sinica FACHB-800 TaxID=1357546 RepID=A0A975T4Y7_9NOST|nr:twin-arginine translocase TatA/TatE family subunit [Richelia sinica]MBD2664945.1 twin-arginine translocase TatA/TatE family subunit [Richelia sinica FACHB-800]QXE22296.1 twin-arginine translocation protein, TatA/E family subunit [Richelia sinica FACHB-800]
MFGLGWPEVVIIAVVALLIFGPKKIPELGGVLGKSLRNFQEGIKKTNEDHNLEEEEKF